MILNFTTIVKFFLFQYLFILKLPNIHGIPYKFEIKNFTKYHGRSECGGRVVKAAAS